MYYVGQPLLFEDPEIKTTSIEVALDMLASYAILGCDTETTGLNPRKDNLLSIQLGNYDSQVFVHWAELSGKDRQQLIDGIRAYKGKLVFHNVKFDAGFLKSIGIDLKRVYCTYLAEKVLSTGRLNHPSSFSFLVEKYCQVTLEKESRLDFTKESFQITKRAIVYGCNDVKYLLKLKEAQEPQLEKYKLVKVANLESSAALAFADIEYEGMKLDIAMWMGLYKDNLKNSRALELEISDQIYYDDVFAGLFPKAFQGDLFKSVDEVKKVPLNLSSPKQLLPVLERVSPFVSDTSARTIELLKSKHSVIAKISQFKKLSKLVSTYGKDMLELLEDGKIHTSIRQILNTGRISSSKPNMQQLPGSNTYRNCFVAPDGWVYVSADYSSQELCIIAVGSQDPVWLSALREGKDLHSVCAELVFKERWVNAAESDCAYYNEDKKKCECPQHGKLRSSVKAINFGLAYGMGPNKLADSLQITEEEAEELIADYFTVFPSIRRFLESLGNFGKRKGYIKTYPPFSRIRWFDEWFPRMKDMRVLGSIERQSKNTPIQGTAADMTKLALVLVRNKILDEKLPAKIVMTVHDQIDTICPLNYAETWREILIERMETAAEFILGNSLLKSEANITNRWSK